MKIINFENLPFDLNIWRTKPFHEKVKMACQAYVEQGFAEPLFVYAYHTVKIAGFVCVWFFFCSLSVELGRWEAFLSWWHKPEALLKLIAWWMLFENLGLGCASGPGSMKIFPPHVLAVQCLTPGTLKRPIPLFSKLPLIGGDRRNILDNLLYAAHIFFLFRACLSQELMGNIHLILPTVIIFPILGIMDKMIFLSGRGEITWIAYFCFLFSVQEAIIGLKLIWVSVWFWAAVSKINKHFAGVVCAMLCNNIFLHRRFKRKLFSKYPDDLRPGLSAKMIANAAVMLELSIPLLLVFGGAIDTFSGIVPQTNFSIPIPEGNNLPVFVQVGLTIMVIFHCFIISNFPFAVPLEWNIVHIFTGLFLFGAYHDVSLFAISNYMFLIPVFAMVIIIPLLGSMFPKYISFLAAMRYYSGNWPIGIWFIKAKVESKIEKNIRKISPNLGRQFALLDFPPGTAEASNIRGIAFRSLHLLGRGVHTLLPKAVDNVNKYQWREGEIMCSCILGWSFGDGHLHNEELVAALHRRCNFASGEVRVIILESQPLFRGHANYRIVDGKDGIIDEGKLQIKDLDERLPWQNIDQRL